MSSDPPAPSRVLCLGEPLVDLICDRPLERVCDADAFVRRPAVAAAMPEAVLESARACERWGALE